MIRFVIMTVLLIVLATAVAEEEIIAHEEGEIVLVTERIDWRSQVIFYVIASPPVSSDVQSAIRLAIDENPEWCEASDDEPTVCDERNFLVFVGVTADGKELLSGYACGESLQLPALKYYSEALVENPPCVRVYWDEEVRAFYIYD